MKRRICVVGQGAWGRALSHVAQSAGHDVRHWSRQVPDSRAIKWSEAIILAVPAQAVRETMGKLAVDDQVVIIAAKGIECASGILMAEVVREVAPGVTPLVLSGPSFAVDVMQGLPTAVVLAADSLETAGIWAGLLTLPTFRIYQSNDVRGVELGGALKNVMAIACGISDGRGLGASARAALITRGFAELLRFCRAMGGREETLMGLSGLGDLLLTCSSPQSRNYAFGFSIGKGDTPEAALANANGVVEGAATAAITISLALKLGIEMPIVQGVHAIVDNGAEPADVIRNLLARPAFVEFD